MAAKTAKAAKPGAARQKPGRAAASLRRTSRRPRQTTRPAIRAVPTIVRRAIQTRLLTAPGVQQLPSEDQRRLERDACTVAAFATLVAEVDFPRFVASLLKGVFEAIVDTSRRQTEAYGDLLSSVASSLDEFADTPARGAELVAALPGIFELCADGTIALRGGCPSRPPRRAGGRRRVSGAR